MTEWDLCGRDKTSVTVRWGVTGTGLSKKETSSGGSQGGLSGYLSLSECPTGAQREASGCQEVEEGVSETQGFRERPSQNSKETWKTRPENLNKAPWRGKAAEETFRRNRGWG